MSCQWLFMRGKRSIFSSDVNSGPVMVTGQYRDIDLLQFFSQHPILNRLVDSEITKQKETRAREERYDDREPAHIEKMKLVR